MRIRNRNSVHVTSVASLENVAAFRPLRLIVQSLLLFSLCLAGAEGQQGGRSSMRDQVREIEQVEMNRELLLKRLPATNDNAGRQALLKQIREDFRDIQGLNNKMMADTWSREEPNYDYISDILSQIRGKANRLKSNLVLPEAPDSDKKEFPLARENARELRAALLVLDKSIMSFVTNPIFGVSKVVEMKMATQASQDLETVLRLSGQIKKAASTLNKKSKDNH